MEIWRDIEGYAGLYQVSNLGRVKSLGNSKTRKEKILKPQTTRYGYLQVQLWKNGKAKFHTVHRLVALAFIPNPDNKPQINHKSEIRTQNTVWVNEDGTIDPEKSNLEWTSVKENINWGSRNERVRQKKSKPVKQLTLGGVFVAIWSSTIETGKNGFSQSSVWQCCQGKRKTHKGYKWQWV